MADGTEGTEPDNRIVTDPRVRPVEDRDFDSIQRIYADAIVATISSFELDPPSAAELRQRHGRLASAGYPYLIAEVDARIAGYCYAGPFRDRPAYRYTVEDSVYVDRSFQRRSVGRRLLGALIDDCEARGFRQMIAVIGGGASTASARLHERLGFVPVGTLENVGWKFDAWQDVFLMQRLLGNSTQPAAPRS